MRHIILIAVILTLIAGATLGAVGIAERANDDARSLVIERGSLADIHAFNINRDTPDLSVAGIPVAQNFRAD